MTFGVVPSRPETGYGYVRCGEALGDGEVLLVLGPSASGKSTALGRCNIDPPAGWTVPLPLVVVFLIGPGTGRPNSLNPPLPPSVRTVAVSLFCVAR